MRFFTFMSTPVGRGIRVAGGVALMATGLAIGGTPGLGLAAFSVLPIATGLFGMCPINPLIGRPMRSCAIPQRTANGS